MAADEIIWDGTYVVNPDIKYKYTWQLNKRTTLEPGDTIKVKGQRGTFKYKRYAKNLLKNKAWIECSDKDQHHRAFRPADITKERPRKSRK